MVTIVKLNSRKLSFIGLGNSISLQFRGRFFFTFLIFLGQKTIQIKEHFTDYNYILLLEEDYYVSEDIFQLATEHVLPQLKVCEETGICLGSFIIFFLKTCFQLIEVKNYF